ncbi:MAG: serine/threonine protein kinase [Pirellulales bacterium]|nr:serine/threonine protein kinase [Pirellulales bacterium]
MFLAIDPTLGRQVALKVPRPEALVLPEIRRRFIREAQATARLTHPNIVAVHEAGEVGTLCYLAADYCDGPTLAAWLRARPQPVAPRVAARLIAQLVDAVDYAHARNVIHRDLKPGNVLLQRRGASGQGPDELSNYEPRLTDFGLAKLFEQDGDETATGTMLGTMAYMSPEQAEGRVHEIGPAADIFALGTMLYELLTGRTPHRGASEADTLRRIVSEEPLAPRRLQPRISRDLEAICLKCLEKQPERRYRSAQYLREDLERFLRDEPTRARPLRLSERLTKWARRRPAVAALAIVSCVAFFALLAAGAWYSIQMARHARELAAALDTAEAGQREAVEQRKRAEEQTALARSSQLHTRRLLYAADLHLAQRAWLNNDPQRARELLTQYLPQLGEADLREFAWRYLWDKCNRPVKTLRGHQGSVYGVAYAPDGHTVASVGADAVVRIWDAANGDLLCALTGHEGEINSLAFSPDGQLLATASDDATVFLWDIKAQSLHRKLDEPKHGVFGLAFSPDGRQLAACGKDKVIYLWDVAQGTLLATLSGHRDFVQSVAFSPDGGSLFSTSDDRTARQWDLANKAEMRTWATQPRQIAGLAVSHDGRLLAIAGRQGVIELYDLRTGEELSPLVGHTGAVHTLTFSPGDRLLASASDDATVRVWNTHTSTERLIFAGHGDRIWSTAFSPDGRSIATASADGTVKLSQLGEPYVALNELPMQIWGVGFTTASQAIWCGGPGEPGRIVIQPISQANWTTIITDQDDQKLRHVLQQPRDGSWIALFATGEMRRIWIEGNSIQQQAVAHHLNVHSVALSPDGRFLAAANQDIQVWDTTDWNLVATLKGHSAAVPALKFSPTSTLLASGDVHGVIKLWEVPFDKPCVTLPPQSQDVRALCFSPDGKRLAWVGHEPTVTLWDLVAQRQQLVLAGHTARLTAVAWSPDGRTVASSGDDNVVRLWDPDTGRELLALPGHTQRVDHLVFSPDGTHLLSCVGGSNTAFLWCAPAAVGSPIPKSDADAIAWQHKISPEDIPVEQDSTRSGETARILPPGTWPSLMDVEKLLAALTGWSRRQGRPLAIPTFDNRETDEGVLVGAISFPGAVFDEPPADQASASRRLEDQFRDVEAYCQAMGEFTGFPNFNFPGSLTRLPSQGLERRFVGEQELGPSDSPTDLFREIHRWAKRQGFVGGYPSFLQNAADGQRRFEAVLVPPAIATEIWIPASELR